MSKAKTNNAQNTPENVELAALRGFDISRLFELLAKARSRSLALLAELVECGLGCVGLPLFAGRGNGHRDNRNHGKGGKSHESEAMAFQRCHAQNLPQLGHIVNT